MYPIFSFNLINILIQIVNETIPKGQMNKNHLKIQISYIITNKLSQKNNM